MLWKLLAFVVSRKPIADYLIKRAKRTPYFHLEGYMNRWWLWNSYEGNSSSTTDTRSWLMKNVFPAVRIHHILRADLARDLHDHPWNARTIILKGDYTETREDGKDYLRLPGDTAKLAYGEYHTINYVSKGGVWTMFFTWKYQGTWGFLVDGKKVPLRQYLGETT